MRPERRTRSDLIVAATLMVAVLVVGLIIALRSSVRGSELTRLELPADEMALTALPDNLRSAWSVTTESPLKPVALGTVVAVADGNTVTAYAQATGAPAWSYRRDHPLCGLSANSAEIVALYRDARGCGEMVAFEPATGDRKYTRSGAADADVTVTGVGSYVVAQGPTKVNSFRSDLVKTVEYGLIEAVVNPNTQPRSNCTQLSALPEGTSLFTLERCPGEAGIRLTQQKLVPKESDTPEVETSAVVPALGIRPGTRIIAVGDSAVLVARPAENGLPAELITVKYDGSEATTMAVTGPLPTTTPAHGNGIVAVYTGTSTIAFDSATLAVKYQVPDTTGPGVVIGAVLVVPRPGALSEYATADGAVIDTRAVPLPEPTGDPTELAVIGATLVASWDDGGVRHVLGVRSAD